MSFTLCDVEIVAQIKMDGWMEHKTTSARLATARAPDSTQQSTTVRDTNVFYCCCCIVLGQPFTQLMSILCLSFIVAIVFVNCQITHSLCIWHIS